MLTNLLQEKNNVLQKQGFRRSLRHQEGSQTREIILQGRRVLNFCSNNYLGLADDLRLKEAAIEALQKEGVGSGASRLVCGNMASHDQLEKSLACFKKTESALVFSTGYMANVGIISSLFGSDDIIFSDRLNHASIIDGIILSRADFRRYPHVDMTSLEKMLKGSPANKKKVIVTDSVFSMDGDLAPLDKIAELALKYDCLVMIDEAHALGIFGPQGEGLAAHLGVAKRIDIQMGTLSKAVGVFGAYAAGSKELTDILINKARSFIYTTSLPPSVAAASKKAIEIIQNEPDLRVRLWKNTLYVKEKLKSLGLNTMNSASCIIPILIGDSQKTFEFSSKLLEEGIFISAIRPPTVPVNTARLRLTLMATHTREDLDRLIEAMERVICRYSILP